MRIAHVDGPAGAIRITHFPKSEQGAPRYLFWRDAMRHCKTLNPHGAFYDLRGAFKFMFKILNFKMFQNVVQISSLRYFRVIL